jgi:5-(carboxyamino)imidazole ribonucleotide synthase
MVLDPDPEAPAAAVANEHLYADYLDQAALERLGRSCAAITVEYDSVPVAALETLARLTRVRPAPDTVAIAHDRILEKRFLAANTAPVARHAEISASAEVDAAFAHVGGPALLKRARFGYEGNGQVRVETAEAARAAFDAFAAFGAVPAVLEARVPFETEISVVLVRGADGAVAVYPPVENQHRNGVLVRSIAPARIPAAVAQRATELAERLAKQLNYLGVLTVEFFVQRNGGLLVNRLAPRPHTSGHFTLDACATGQFEQQVRALCGMPLGSTELLQSAVTVNLLGEHWQRGTPDWPGLLRVPGAQLHLYDKRPTRAQRKMGHVTCVAPTLDQAFRNARTVEGLLAPAAGLPAAAGAA